MKATDILRTEHGLITQVVAALRELAAEGRAQGRIDGDSATLAIEFVRNFTDRCHHAKEERYLFPALVAAGLPEERGPVSVMLAEHKQGRAYVREMDASREAAAAGDGAAVDRFVTAALGYSELLAGHIDKENQVLFVLADSMLDEAQQAALYSDFERVEAEEMGAGTHEHFHAIGEQLVERYGGGTETSGQGAAGCGCNGHHAASAAH